MSVIKPTMTLYDSRGVAWTTSENYQDRDTTAPGWLELKSSDGRLLQFFEVVESYGFVYPEGHEKAGARYLVGHVS